MFRDEPAPSTPNPPATITTKVPVQKFSAPPPTSPKAATVEPPPEHGSEKSKNKSNSEFEAFDIFASDPFFDLPKKNDTKEAVPPPKPLLPVKKPSIPSYTINDKSKVEITSVTHDFQKSMAENHFASTSVEATV